MTNDCKTCPVSTGTHKPAEAVHQIAEPDAQHLQELAAYRFTVENREARIAELEGQLEAIGAGGVEPLRKQAAAPQAVQAAVPDGWKRVPIKPTPEMCHVGRYGGDKDAPAYGEKPAEGVTAWPFVADHTAEQIYQSMLAAAPAHPAEGVSAAPTDPALSRACDLLSTTIGALIGYREKVGYTDNSPIAGLVNEAVEFLRPWPEKLPTATQPAALGMDALYAARWREVLQHVGAAPHFGGQHFTLNTLQAPDTPLGFKANLMSGSAAQHFTKAIDAAIAARAEQGGA